MTKQRSNKFSPEVRELAVRMVFDHQTEHGSQLATIMSIASKIGCTAETLRSWVRQAERDEGQRAGGPIQPGLVCRDLQQAFCVSWQCMAIRHRGDSLPIGIQEPAGTDEQRTSPALVD
jgi:transposase